MPYTPANTHCIQMRTETSWYLYPYSPYIIIDYAHMDALINKQRVIERKNRSFVLSKGVYVKSNQNRLICIVVNELNGTEKPKQIDPHRGEWIESV